MASLICPRCNNLRFSSTGASIEINIPKWRQTREAQSNPSDLADWHLAQAQEERSAGCSSCQLLWNGVEAVLGRDFHVRYESMLLKYIEPQHRGGPMTVVLGDTWDLRLWKKQHDARLGVKELQFYLASDEPVTLSTTMIGKGYDISPHGLSGSCMNLAQKWLQDCSQGKGKHAKCPQAVQTELPTRVIDIEEMRLHCPAPEVKGLWVSLSHCWGGSSPLQTTTGNLESHMARLPDPLPQTFADAVAVTRMLGLRYLWIDSLCIIQDSHEDWVHESAHMATVYENAYVTISADAAKDSFQGFLSAPSRSVRKEAEIDYTYVDEAENEQHHVIHVRERGKLALMLPYHDWIDRPRRRPRYADSYHGEPPDNGQQLPFSRLSTRGWVFQERILAPRTLHFARSEMAWECRSICDCECSATSYRSVRNTSLLKYWLSDLHQPDENHSYWRTEIVPEYSRLNLTHETDRLVALAGLAEAIKRKRPDDVYLVGLWKNTFIWDLLWCVHGGESSRLKPTVAPTWSWASVTGSVVYPLTERKTTSHLGHNMCAKFQIRTSIVESAQQLVLSGYTIATQLQTPSRTAGNDVYLEMVGERSRVLPQLVASLDLSRLAPLRTGRSYLHYESLRFLVVCWLDDGPCGILLRETRRKQGVKRTEEPTEKSYERVGFVRPLERRPLRMTRRGSSISSYDKDTENASRTMEETMSRMSVDCETKGVASWSHLLEETTVVIR